MSPPWHPKHSNQKAAHGIDFQQASSRTRLSEPGGGCCAAAACGYCGCCCCCCCCYRVAKLATIIVIARPLLPLNLTHLQSLQYVIPQVCRTSLLHTCVLPSKTRERPWLFRSS